MSNKKDHRPAPTYVIHPVSVEQKAKLRAKGALRIIDARWAPSGAEIVDADGKKPKAEAPSA